MGTRNLFTIIHNNKVVLAKYNQWDGYLDGQGNDLSDFIVNHLDFEKLKDNLKAVRFCEESEIDEKTKDIKDDSFSGMFPASFSGMFPLLSRDIGIMPTLKAIQYLRFTTEKTSFDNGKMNRQVLKHKIKPENLITFNNSDFINDGLFCEYAYTLNLDNYSVSVYESGNNLLFSCDILEYPETLQKHIDQRKEL